MSETESFSRKQSLGRPLRCGSPLPSSLLSSCPGWSAGQVTRDCVGLEMSRARRLLRDKQNPATIVLSLVPSGSHLGPVSWLQVSRTPKELPFFFHPKLWGKGAKAIGPLEIHALAACTWLWGLVSS